MHRAPRHPLKKISLGESYFIFGKCHFCRDTLGQQYYYCSICNFSVDLKCWIDKPQLTIYQPKSHEHTFTLMARRDSFTCNACGMVGDRNPYVCLECNFMLHKDCIYLPRVININRHKHRISRTYHLGPGFGDCGVCREEINWTFGAFFCKSCPDYAVHSICATRKDVWDGEEHEDDPEEEEEEDPYKVINEREIIHFSHKHNLRLDDDYAADYEACGKYSEFVLSCIVCDFNLGMDCGILPRKVKHRCDDHFLSLHHGAGRSKGQLWCDSCEGKLDPSVWFYGCDDCGTNLHIDCVLGDLYYLKPGNKYAKSELVANNGMTRPFCIVCENRCMSSSFLKATDESNSTIVYACSMLCAYGHRGRDWYYEVKVEYG
ncbi:PREDICTED: uncharacterized protein LOC104763358 [Camelina sativa]|uniref:Uncharacterized protein LOC104763358 n=1 Tax=Camelina sativa TaxID=90675 RepID=A0ABM0XF53_CAMSA|nr:PREDICTED: uncharacterized protein LOC104763358 [Camelina sativa]